MWMRSNAILEVDGIAKLYSRRQTTIRRRLAEAFVRALLRRPPRPPGALKPGEFWGLKDISFTLERGEALGIIGLNGAGKTTLLRILAGQILPDEGEVRILGDTAAMIDLTAGFRMTASGRDNIFLRGAMLGRSHEEITAKLEDIIDFAELGDAINAPVNTYSSGMLMRLAFSIMVAMEPDILFIDEILAVGDFRFRQKCLRRIRELRDRAAFVLVSHNMNDIKLFCTKAIVLNKGRIAFQGEPAEAIEVYEKLQFPETPEPEKRRKETLKPQFHNAEAITDIEHYWCDAQGNPIDAIKSGDPLYFKVRFRLSHTPRNLILGIPMWREDGVLVTGFSTPRDGSGVPAKAGEPFEAILEVPHCPLNPGEYISNIAIVDGVEFLARIENQPLTILNNRRKESWGVISINHYWHLGAKEREEAP